MASCKMRLQQAQETISELLGQVETGKRDYNSMQATIHHLTDSYDRVKQQRDGLLVALKALNSALDSCVELTPELMRKVSEVIANAEKQS